ncbi:phospholipase A [Massilia forsythiae]|uniref:phospholipase A n=1 Tax=Massilia forsythiae TaxID=2728020 RepID=UPI001E40CBFC|nr:phospholipase A [Massilia forsythiae]
MSECTRIADADLRLACYDRLAGAAPQARPTPAAAVPGASVAAAAPARADAPAVPLDAGVDAALDLSPEKTRGYSLADHWELDQAHKRGIFNVRPHRNNYVMVTRTAHPNSEPYRPFHDITDLATDLSHSEIAFQLGFKVKLVEDAFNKPVSLWFGYTQNSFWQAGNHKASSPFRETNYQPELMAVAPLDFNVLGFHASFINLGVVHQSNGQASTLSRSWNRVYAQLGLERGGWTVMGRVWKRVNESAPDDDNRDIVDYMGRGDLNVTYRDNGHEYSALVRRNFSTERGAVQLSWAFPIAGHVKGYAQYFTGYGQSLIDYNYYQNSLGLGLQGTF